MDYSNNVLTTFLNLEGCSCVAVCARLRKLSDFIKHFLIHVSKMNGFRLKGLGKYCSIQITAGSFGNCSNVVIGTYFVSC